MAAFYGRRIKADIMTLAQVPKLWKTVTERWLEQNQG